MTTGRTPSYHSSGFRRNTSGTEKNLRRKDTKKWYAARLVLSRRRPGLDPDEISDILDLRIRTDGSGFVVDHQRYVPRYHMNKNHWYTICPDGPVQIDENHQRIDASYALAEK